MSKGITLRVQWTRWALTSLTLALASGMALAQRDPTAVPFDAGSTSAGAGAPASALGDSGMSVIVRDGKSYLVVGTRLVAPGQRVGAATLERITETEVWLREGATLQKLPRFAGIQRSNSAAAPVTTAVATQCKTAKSRVPAPGAARTSAPNKPKKVGTQPRARVASRVPSVPCDSAKP